MIGRDFRAQLMRALIGNHADAVLGAVAGMRGVVDVVVLHDNHCRLLNSRGHCNCKPVVRAREVRS